MMRAWKERVAYESRRRSELYAINKCFQVLVKHAKVSLSKEARICSHLRNHLLLKNYFAKLRSFSRYCAAARKADHQRRKAIFRTWKKTVKLIKLNNQKLQMIKVYLDKKKKYRMLPKYFKIL